jgi:hypothetical protein
VIHQTLDGEAVVINLDNGRYYAFNQCGSLIWNALAAGHAETAVADALAPSSTTDRDAISHFVDQLVDQGLVANHGEQSVPPPTTSLPARDVAFAEPHMEVYTDMERLLPLDPLHEVDERGWPHRKG